MTKHSNEQKLIDDLLSGEDDLREQTLNHGLVALRRKRVHRRAIRAGAAVAALLVLLALIHVNRERPQAVARLNPPNFKPQTIAPPAPPAVIAGTTIRVLTDQELLDLFQGHPVALVGTPGKQKLIIFDAANH